MGGRYNIFFAGLIVPEQSPHNAAQARIISPVIGHIALLQQGYPIAVIQQTGHAYQRTGTHRVQQLITAPVLHQTTVPLVAHLLHGHHIRPVGVQHLQKHFGPLVRVRAAPALIMHQQIGTHNAGRCILGTLGVRLADALLELLANHIIRQITSAANHRRHGNSRTHCCHQNQRQQGAKKAPQKFSHNLPPQNVLPTYYTQAGVPFPPYGKNKKVLTILLRRCIFVILIIERKNGENRQLENNDDGRSKKEQAPAPADGAAVCGGRSCHAVVRTVL